MKRLPKWVFPGLLLCFLLSAPGLADVTPEGNTLVNLPQAGGECQSLGITNTAANGPYELSCPSFPLLTASGAIPIVTDGVIAKGTFAEDETEAWTPLTATIETLGDFAQGMRGNEVPFLLNSGTIFKGKACSCGMDIEESNSAVKTGSITTTEADSPLVRSDYHGVFAKSGNLAPPIYVQDLAETFGRQVVEVSKETFPGITPPSMLRAPSTTSTPSG